MPTKNVITPKPRVINSTEPSYSPIPNGLKRNNNRKTILPAVSIPLTSVA